MSLPFESLSKIYDCTGRSTRREYWLFTLISVCVGVAVLVWESGSLPYGVVFGPGFTLYCLFLAIPSWAVSVRRLHDGDFSGWWVLVGVIPVAGWVIQLVLFSTEGSQGSNQYGSDPRVAGATDMKVKDIEL